MLIQLVGFEYFQGLQDKAHNQIVLYIHLELPAAFACCQRSIQNRKYQLFQTFTTEVVRLAQNNFSTDVKEHIVIVRFIQCFI